MKRPSSRQIQLLLLPVATELRKMGPGRQRKAREVTLDFYLFFSLSKKADEISLRSNVRHSLRFVDDGNFATDAKLQKLHNEVA